MVSRSQSLRTLYVTTPSSIADLQGINSYCNEVERAKMLTRGRKQPPPMLLSKEIRIVIGCLVVSSRAYPICTRLLCVAALLTMPRSARAQQLYVAWDFGDTVGEYNAATGSAINANSISVGVNYPAQLALSGDGTTLFVANSGGNT